MAAETSSSLMEALQNLREGLLHDPSLKTSKEQVQEVSKRKFAACGGADGGVWTPEVARAFFMCLQTFAIPVVPSPAYPGQSFPPPYLFTTPP